MRSLVWFRGKDLRVADHAPLVTAARGRQLIPVFVIDPHVYAPERARRLAHPIQFLFESLRSLEQALTHLGSRLLIVEGESVEVIPRLAERWRVDRVLAQRSTDPFGRERDQRVAAALAVPFDLLEGETLRPPATLRTSAGKPYRLFTPFARAFRAVAADVGEPLPPPRHLPPVPGDLVCPEALTLPPLFRLGIRENPRLLMGGSPAAQERLRAFLRGPLATYASDRDRMDVPGTSRLSADLTFGTLSPRTVWTAVRDSEAAVSAPKSANTFGNQLLWREFAYATLWDRPDLLTTPFRQAFKDFPWRHDDGDWRAWVDGTTGYPVVDAAARQLLAEGMVHNRARMIAASFLAKQFLIDFRRGETHYLEHLVDGDWANNDMGWQWSAGCGCDAQPYFRIFNPTAQGARFDPEGSYVRAWVPELARLPAKHIHCPSEAPPEVLAAAGLVLDKTYPTPRVNHVAARDRYLRVAEGHLGRRG